jgi:hypothetical protein
MAKKKNSPKKHRFKHVEAAPVSQLDNVRIDSGAAAPATAPAGQYRPAAVMAGQRDFSYVAQDIRRIAVMAGILVAVELAFYYVLVFTPVGAAIYRLVNV